MCPPYCYFAYLHCTVLGMHIVVTGFLLGAVSSMVLTACWLSSIRSSISSVMSVCACIVYLTALMRLAVCFPASCSVAWSWARLSCSAVCSSLVVSCAAIDGLVTSRTGEDVDVIYYACVLEGMVLIAVVCVLSGGACSGSQL